MDRVGSGGQQESAKFEDFATLKHDPASFPYQAMKLVSEGEDRSCGRDNSQKTAEESSLLELYLPGNPLERFGRSTGGESSALTMVRGPS